MNTSKKITVLLSIIILATFVLTSCSKDDDNDNGTKKNTRVSQINITKFGYALGERSDKGEKYEIHFYNSDGLLTQSKMYHFGVNDGVEYSIDYKYDNANRIIEKKDGSMEYTYKYTYTDFDSIAVESKYNTKDGSINERVTYTYDSQNRKIKKVTESAVAGDVFNRTVSYEYDGNKVTATDVYTKTNERFGTFIYEYDNQGNIQKVTFINGSTGKESIEDQYEYDYLQDGRIKSYKNYYGLYGGLTKYEYTYNDDNTINSILVSVDMFSEQYELVYDYIYAN